MMALTVEDGTGLAGADSLITLAAFKAYADARGWDYSSYNDTTAIEPAIRRGSLHISNSFTYAGTKVSRTQAFAWPRYDVTDKDGYAVLSTEVPTEVAQAVSEATWRELASAGSLNPDVTLTARAKSETVGPLSVTYADVPMSANAARPDVGTIKDLLRGLLASSGATVGLVRS